MKMIARLFVNIKRLNCSIRHKSRGLWKKSDAPGHRYCVECGRVWKKSRFGSR